MGNSNGTSRDTETVLIIGSGSTGLALAQGLQKNGIRCIVFEKDPNLTAKSRDWNLGLHWGAPVLRGLMPESLWERIQSVQVDPNVPTKPLDTLYFLNSATGERMAGPQIDNFYRLKRSKLRALLAENVDIRFGKRLSNIEYSADGKSVTALFDDGTKQSGRILIGADGARSAVRNLAVGNPVAAQSVRMPYAATFTHASFPREKALFLRSWHPLFLAGVHPHGLFSFLGIQDATNASVPESWIFFFYISFPCSVAEQEATAGWDNNARLRQVKEFARSYAEPWKSAFEWLPDDHPVWYMGMTDWDPSAPAHAWSTHGGRVTLAGDAAHTMTYQRGQGLNHSITDAARLTEAIVGVWKGEGQLKDAIEGYEEEMKERAGAEVRMSSQNTGMLHSWERVLESPVFKKGLQKQE